MRLNQKNKYDFKSNYIVFAVLIVAVMLIILITSYKGITGRTVFHILAGECCDDGDCTDPDYPFCVGATEPVEECRKDMLAYGGTCVECESDSDCGTDGLLGNDYCNGDDVWEDYRDYSCISSACTYSDTGELKEVCTDTCEAGVCVDVECYDDSDCDSDYWLNNPYCNGTKEVWDTYRDYTCINPGTSSSDCTYSDTNKSKEICSYKCENGACAAEPSPEPTPAPKRPTGCIYSYEYYNLSCYFDNGNCVKDEYIRGIIIKGASGCVKSIDRFYKKHDCDPSECQPNLVLLSLPLKSEKDYLRAEGKKIEQIDNLLDIDKLDIDTDYYLSASIQNQGASLSTGEFTLHIYITPKSNRSDILFYFNKTYLREIGAGDIIEIDLEDEKINFSEPGIYILYISLDGPDVENGRIVEEREIKVDINCLDYKPGNGKSAWLLSLDDPIVRKKAEVALMEFVNDIKLNKINNEKLNNLINVDEINKITDINNSDNYMVVIGWYVDKHMTYVSDENVKWQKWLGYEESQYATIGDYTGSVADFIKDTNQWLIGSFPTILWTAFDVFRGEELEESFIANLGEWVLEGGSPDIQTASQTVRLSGKRCDNDYCGDCEDFAALRLALLRALEINPKCVFGVEHYIQNDQGQRDVCGGGEEGHTFNIVYFNGKYRIMDYHELGNYFNVRNCWASHAADNVWNDDIGMYWRGGSVGPFPVLTNKYADGTYCPVDGWHFTTVYEDVCK